MSGIGKSTETENNRWSPGAGGRTRRRVSGGRVGDRPRGGGKRGLTSDRGDIATTSWAEQDRLLRHIQRVVSCPLYLSSRRHRTHGKSHNPLLAGPAAPGQAVGAGRCELFVPSREEHATLSPGHRAGRGARDAALLSRAARRAGGHPSPGAQAI